MAPRKSTKRGPELPEGLVARSADAPPPTEDETPPPVVEAPQLPEPEMAQTEQEVPQDGPGELPQVASVPQPAAPVAVRPRNRTPSRTAYDSQQRGEQLNAGPRIGSAGQYFPSKYPTRDGRIREDF